MCGRFVLTLDYNMLVDILKGRFDIENIKSQLDYIPRYNIAPSQQVLSVISNGINERIGYLKWGFIPSWSKDVKFNYKMINARSETIDNRPAYRKSFISRRCLILSNGFYEWKKDGTNKKPMFITLKNKNLFCMARLYNIYYTEKKEKISTCTILTTSPNELISSIHNRMPVILNKKDEKNWLNPQIKDSIYLKSLLQPYKTDEMQAIEVSSLVNSPKNDNPLCTNRFVHNLIQPLINF
ncbi:putative SOS response-associated peptidase YoqW [Vallitalea longa]|uniref:Abasic site processing protein n=1 Tax=Vallitalea longa TaxID=2936439 RepID=A0A9W6DET1_9FIRM|nr:SOS response-associated peptidase [Vallitalea longa]GKX29850.1 putative SOS response-associated peptidase YoqW [Vallitalea longa]